MCELWPVMAKYSQIGVLMVYLCEFRSKTDNEARHGFLAIRYMPNGVPQYSFAPAGM